MRCLIQNTTFDISSGDIDMAKGEAKGSSSTGRANVVQSWYLMKKPHTNIVAVELPPEYGSNEELYARTCAFIGYLAHPASHLNIQFEALSSAEQQNINDVLFSVCVTLISNSVDVYRRVPLLFAFLIMFDKNKIEPILNLFTNDQCYGRFYKFLEIIDDPSDNRYIQYLKLNSTNMRRLFRLEFVFLYAKKENLTWFFQLCENAHSSGNNVEASDLIQESDHFIGHVVLIKKHYLTTQDSNVIDIFDIPCFTDPRMPSLFNLMIGNITHLRPSTLVNKEITSLSLSISSRLVTLNREELLKRQAQQAFIEKLKLRVVEDNAAINNLNEELSAAQCQVSLLMKQEKKTQLEAHIKVLKEKISLLIQEKKLIKDNLNSQISRLRQDKKSLTCQVSQLTKQLDDLKKQSSAEQKNKKYEKLILQHQDAIGDYQQRALHLEQQLVQFVEMTRKIKANFNRVKKDLLSLRENVTEYYNQTNAMIASTHRLVNPTIHTLGYPSEIFNPKFYDSTLTPIFNLEDMANVHHLLVTMIHSIYALPDCAIYLRGILVHRDIVSNRIELVLHKVSEKTNDLIQILCNSFDSIDHVKGPWLKEIKENVTSINFVLHEEGRKFHLNVLVHSNCTLPEVIMCDYTTPLSFGLRKMTVIENQINIQDAEIFCTEPEKEEILYCLKWGKFKIFNSHYDEMWKRMMYAIQQYGVCQQLSNRAYILQCISKEILEPIFKFLYKMHALHISSEPKNNHMLAYIYRLCRCFDSTFPSAVCKQDLAPWRRGVNSHLSDFEESFATLNSMSLAMVPSSI